MPKVKEIYSTPGELLLGMKINENIPEADQVRQRVEVDEILKRLRNQPGVILADEVGTGKTFCALAIAYSIAMNSPKGPVIIMVPANLVDKWEQDLKTFCELYVEDRIPLNRDEHDRKALTAPTTIRYGVARHSVELMKLLDDPRRTKCHLIFLAQGAMARRQTDKWIRLALISECLRRHARGGASRLIKVKAQIPRFMARLIYAIGEENAHGWGHELWQALLRTYPSAWMEIYNRAVTSDRRLLNDDPVPKAVERALQRIDLKPLAEKLAEMPIRARGGDERVAERIDAARDSLRTIEEQLWKSLLAEARWRSPLLVMDEAHHLKNPGASLSRQLQSPDLDRDLKTGDGAMANSFDRMLFLTATPFQLGHHELVRVLERFGDVRWDKNSLGDIKDFRQKLQGLWNCLDASQRSAIALQRSWSKLRPEDVEDDIEKWWSDIVSASLASLNGYQRAVVQAYQAAKEKRNEAQPALSPWVVRHNKGELWQGTNIPRRLRQDGAGILDKTASKGLPIPPDQILPFFLGARSAFRTGQDLLGEALCSSYEAFRFTRQNREDARDEQEANEGTSDLSHARWYLGEFDRALEDSSGAIHPKINATVRKAADLWEQGEKVLVFAFYRQTCRALCLHISQEIERRVVTAGESRLRAAGKHLDLDEIEKLLESVRDRFFDKPESPGRIALDCELSDLIDSALARDGEEEIAGETKEKLLDSIRRYLRVSTTLIRCFPLEELDNLSHGEAVGRMIESSDESGVSLREKFASFIEMLVKRCSAEERENYLDAALVTRAGRVPLEADEEGDDKAFSGRLALANVQVATGKTRRDRRSRLMRAFNTPFFPDVLVCSEVMSEGVDLHRACRHVIHHDLAWNPSTIEQRTGRVDRLGCKAEKKHPIEVYLPYIAGTADERQYHVMSDREKWFRVVMGQDQVAELITEDSGTTTPLPDSATNELVFDLGISGV